MLTELKSGKTALCKVRDSCGCVGGGIIDLSPVVFLKFAKLGAGVIRVKIERVEVSN
jgi:rare lipoprotein A (peptidoglycan hydrolase)